MKNKFYISFSVLLFFCFMPGLTAHAGMFQDKGHGTAKQRTKHTKKPKPQKVVKKQVGENEDEDEKYDGIKEAQQYEFNITHDHTTNNIPKYRLITALAQRNLMLRNAPVANGANGTNFVTNPISALSWTERGPNTDAAGPYGNGRDNNDVTAGRIAALWNDLDPAKPNQVFVGGIDGGLWTCADITSATPVWTFLDNFSNIGISSICQDPTNFNILYFGTGEKTFNADAVLGGGVWKSTDHGVTWNLLANTTTFYNVSKILCDNAGNVYVGTIGSGSGLQRSLDGGTSWTAITPTVGTLATSRVSDMAYDASNNRLHVYMGYLPTPGSTKTGYCYGTPSTVTSATWSVPTTGSGMAIATAAATSTTTAYEQMVLLTAKNGIVWALRGNYGNMILYRSTDGGVTWTLQNTLTAAQYGVGQDWYSMGIDCDPASVAASTNNILFGNLNVFKSVNGGTTISQVSEWVSGAYAGQTQYVHADVHNILYATGKMIVCSDGGVFYSANLGTTWRDRNTGLRIKQFYSCATNPADPNYFLAGAQDNGCHQFTQSGLAGSTEVTGGDGAFVSIDQLNPTNQVGSYVFNNNYHISTDNGKNWTSNAFGSNIGQFINPFDFDSKTKKMYAANATGKYLRWDDPLTTQTTSAIITVPALAGQIITAVTVSPNLSNTVYLGIGTGIVVKVTNANTATPTFTTITPPTSTGSVSCIAIGPNASDNDLMVTSSSYGAQKVFVSADGGGTWTDITGTSASKLPDMPVRWGLFFPGSNTQVLLATEAGVWYTTATAGTGTAWLPSAGFPAVRTDMLKYSATNAVIAVATHGRGLWSTKINTQPKVSFSTAALTVSKTSSTTSGCRTYKDYLVNLVISDAPTGTATVTLSPQAGGTAVQGVDFDLTTNGNFAAPSAAATFNNGTYPNSIPVTFRIYDNHNNNAAQPQTAIINIAVTGATDAVSSPVNNTYTLTISDVIKPAIVPATPATGQTIWSEDWESITSGYSSWTFSPDPYHQTIASVNAFIPFFSGCANNINNTTAELLATDAAGNIALCGNGIGGASTAMFYRAVNAGGKNAATNLAVTFNYKSAGGANGITNTLEYSVDGGTTWTVITSYGTKAATTAVTTPLPAVLNNTNFLLGWRYTSTAATPANTTGFAIDDIVLKGDIIVTPIETTAASTTILYETTGQSVDYYSAANNIMATIASPTADLGCVTAAVETAGNTWQVFQGGLRSQKTFHITPSQNTGAAYNATLFFTNAELSGFTPSTLKIAKTSAASFAAADGTNTVIVTPTTVTYGALGVAFTGAFTGFSRFALANSAVALPITLLEFKGTLVNGKGLLQWSTSTEVNSKDFDLERSADGINFYKIGTVKAAGNSSTILYYNFADGKLNALNYYRLRMNDLNGKTIISNTVIIKYTDVKQNVYVVNNPFSSEINIRLAQMPAQKVLVEIFDQKGSKVYSKNFNGLTEININGLSMLAAGNYFLKTTVDAVVYTNQVLKQ